MFPSQIYPVYGAFDQLRRDLNRLLEGATGGVYPRIFSGGYAFPALNIWEDGECFCAEAEVPGMSMDQIDVQIVGNELTIKGERPTLEEKKLTYHRQERGSGTFSRSISLPSEVSPDKVEAVLKDGVLTIKLPKAAAARARKIAVKTQ